jgi:restriction system protein
MTSTPMPTSDDLQSAVVKSLQSNGGRATNAEILQWTVENLGITQAQLEIMRSGNRTEIEYRLAWARTRASKLGLIHRSGPSTWSLGAAK